MRQEVYFDIERTPHAKAWNDLTKNQLFAVMRILYSGKDLLRKFEQLPHVLCNLAMDKHLIITVGDRDKICEFIFKEQPGLTINLLPQLEIGHAKIKVLYGPSDKLGNSTFGEFIMADSFCQNYIRTSDEQWLHKLIACLYRPKKKDYDPSSPDYNGNIREKFNSNNLDSRVGYIEKLPLYAKQAILTYFIGCKNYFASQYTHLFKKGGGGKEASGFPWLNALSSYAKGVQNFDSVLDSNVGIVLFDLDRVIGEGKEVGKYISLNGC